MNAAPFRVLVDDGGAAIVEYALITAGISLVAVTALQAMGISLNDLYMSVVSNWGASARSGG
jgi:Flp pilus assembly pilin Flp